MKKYLLLVILMTIVEDTSAQNIVYDQQSISSDVSPGITTPFQTQQPLGQSFVPSLSEVGVIRLFAEDLTIHGSGSTLEVNLWSGSIGNGNLLATSAPVIIPNGFNGYINFLFPMPEAVTPGTTYYFQPFVVSGDNDNNVGTGIAFNSYANGTAFFSGAANSELDFLFREGVVIPEPSSIVTLLLGFISLRLWGILTKKYD